MVPAEPRDFEYDAFVSYATDPDRDLVHAVETIVEGFHRRPTLPLELKLPLELLNDGTHRLVSLNGGILRV